MTTITQNTMSIPTSCSPLPPDPKPIRFTVLGNAQPAGSKRAFMRPGMKFPVVVDDNAKSKPWKAEVAAAAREVYRSDLLTGPLKVRLVFYRPRPAGHYGANGLNKKGRETSAPVTKPDVLKLARGVEDALTSVVWRDDAQIVVEVIEKRWGEPARCEVEISPVG